MVSILAFLHDVLDDDTFTNLTGVDVTYELPELSRKEVVAIFHTFRDNYAPAWEVSAGKKASYLSKMSGAFPLKKKSFGVQANTVSSADFTAELGSIDFENLIGGPMNAAVTAQSNASISTINFIKEVGFDREGDEVTGLKMVDFSFEKQVDDPSFEPDPDAPDAPVPQKTELVTIKVPFISIVSVPSLRIETLDIDFNVKLNSTYKRKDSSSFKIGGDITAGWGPVKMKVSSSYRRTSSTGVEVKKEYSMGVKVRATNDELPAGLEKVLGLMNI